MSEANVQQIVSAVAQGYGDFNVVSNLIDQLVAVGNVGVAGQLLQSWSEKTSDANKVAAGLRAAQLLQSAK